MTFHAPPGLEWYLSEFALAVGGCRAVGSAPREIEVLEAQLPHFVHLQGSRNRTPVKARLVGHPVVKVKVKVVSHTPHAPLQPQGQPQGYDGGECSGLQDWGSISPLTPEERGAYDRIHVDDASLPCLFEGRQQEESEEGGSQVVDGGVLLEPLSCHLQPPYTASQSEWGRAEGVMFREL